MKDTISILLSHVPKYGEILLGVGGIALTYQDALLDNLLARESIKQYLLNEVSSKKTILGVSNSDSFQRLIYKYTGQFAKVAILTEPAKEEKTVNILLLDFFIKSIWPIIVNRYMDTIYYGVDNVTIRIKVKKTAYQRIYDDCGRELFIKEFKDFLHYNHISMREEKSGCNEDILVKLLLPVPPHSRYEF